MLCKKKVQSFRRRIRNANTSFGVMGDFMLILDIDAMSLDEAKSLQAALLDGKTPIRYGHLDKKCAGAA